MSTERSSDQIDNETQTRKQARGSILFDNWFGKWFIQRLTSVLIWYWIVLRSFGLRLPFGLNFPREYLLIPAGFSMLLMILFGRWPRLFFYPIYVFFFPTIIFWYVIRTAYRIFQFPILAGRFVFSFRAFFILFLLLLGWPLSFSFPDPTSRAILTFVAHTATFLLFVQIFRWASNPYRPLTDTIRFLGTTVTDYIEKQFIRPGLENGDQSRKTAVGVCEYVIRGIDRIYSPEEPLKKGITGFAYGGVAPLAMTLFFFAYLILAVSFSLVFINSEVAWGPLLSGIGKPASFGDYLYFTMLTEATAIPDGIAPVSLLGKILIIWNILTGVLLFTLLITLFTTSVGIHGENAVGELKSLIEAGREKYQDWLALLDRSVEESEETISAEIKEIDQGTSD